MTNLWNESKAEIIGIIEETSALLDGAEIEELRILLFRNALTRAKENVVNSKNCFGIDGNDLGKVLASVNYVSDILSRYDENEATRSKAKELTLRNKQVVVNYLEPTLR